MKPAAAAGALAVSAKWRRSAGWHHSISTACRHSIDIVKHPKLA